MDSQLANHVVQCLRFHRALRAPTSPSKRPSRHQRRRAYVAGVFAPTSSPSPLLARQSSLAISAILLSSNRVLPRFQLPLTGPLAHVRSASSA
ncbi:hypothetical protein K523DRAFT_322728 [Schizophyllum commune Tattone D]|nr:hypothetical protein K523DRAFT_322728 [Schizophyllum commune Tattone D]